MSTVETALRTRLLDDAVVAGLVASRIYPSPLPQAPTLPAITYQRISGGRGETFDGPSGLAWPRIELDFWALTHDGARALFDAARRSLNGAAFVASGVVVQKAQVISETDFYEADVKLHRVSADLMVWHEEE
jgi:hypothetical protein